MDFTKYACSLKYTILGITTSPEQDAFTICTIVSRPMDSYDILFSVKLTALAHIVQHIVTHRAMSLSYLTFRCYQFFIRCLLSQILT